MFISIVLHKKMTKMLLLLMLIIWYGSKLYIIIIIWIIIMVYIDNTFIDDAKNINFPLNLMLL